MALEGGSYNDAISVSRRIVASAPEFVAEGGVRNVARRDGLAVVLLAAFEAAGRLRAGVPAGGWPLPRFRVGQNREFAPLYRAWRDDQSGESGEPGGNGTGRCTPTSW